MPKPKIRVQTHLELIILDLPYKKFIVNQEWPNVTRTLMWVACIRAYGQQHPHGGVLAELISKYSQYDAPTLEMAIQLASTSETHEQAKRLALASLRGQLTLA